MIVKCPSCGNEQVYLGKGGKKAHTKCKIPGCKKDFYIPETIPKKPKTYRESRKKNYIPKDEIKFLCTSLRNQYKNKRASGIFFNIKKVETWLESL